MVVLVPVFAWTSVFVSFNARFSKCAFSFVCPLRHLSECVLANLDSLVPTSFNLFHCPVHVCPVFVLSCTVYVGVGVRFPWLVSVLVYCPILL